jgi:hypothetical protein
MEGGEVAGISRSRYASLRHDFGAAEDDRLRAALNQTPASVI